MHGRRATGTSGARYLGARHRPGKRLVRAGAFSVQVRRVRGRACGEAGGGGVLSDFGVRRRRFDRPYRPGRGRKRRRRRRRLRPCGLRARRHGDGVGKARDRRGSGRGGRGPDDRQKLPRRIGVDKQGDGRTGAHEEAEQHPAQRVGSFRMPGDRQTGPSGPGDRATAVSCCARLDQTHQGRTAPRETVVRSCGLTRESSDRINAWRSGRFPRSPGRPWKSWHLDVVAQASRGDGEVKRSITGGATLCPGVIIPK